MPRASLGSRIDNRRTRRRLIILALVGANFFILWLTLNVFTQADFWPLLAVPILVSAWFFYEAGALATIIVTGLLLVQTSFEKSGTIFIAVATFAVLGVMLGWGQRRQRQAHRHVLRSSLTDSLTGLYNFGSFMECLDREMRRVDRYGGAVTVVMFDIDHFKMFNDRFGHQAGNEALKMMAATLRRQKRESDIVARYGGEEFVLLFPGKEAAGLETARRMRTAISQIRVPVGGGSNAEITVSAGVACYPNGAASREELLDKVDQLLYASKRKGRNRVSVAPRRHRLVAS
jgi:diguanylate cyclase (GGDEF)-like protein